MLTERKVKNLQTFALAVIYERNNVCFTQPLSFIRPEILGIFAIRKLLV